MVLLELSHVVDVHNGNASIDDLAAEILTVLHSDDGINGHLAHDVGVLRHEGQQFAALDVGDVGVRLVPADAIHGGAVVGSVHNRSSRAVGRAVVGAVDRHDAVVDQGVGQFLRLGVVAIGVLTLAQDELRALEDGGEAFSGNVEKGTRIWLKTDETYYDDTDYEIRYTINGKYPNSNINAGAFPSALFA